MVVDNILYLQLILLIYLYFYFNIKIFYFNIQYYLLMKYQSHYCRNHLHMNNQFLIRLDIFQFHLDINLMQYHHYLNQNQKYK